MEVGEVVGEQLMIPHVARQRRTDGRRKNLLSKRKAV